MEIYSIHKQHIFDAPNKNYPLNYKFSSTASKFEVPSQNSNTFFFSKSLKSVKNSFGRKFFKV
jgi:hypothetical protein